MYYCIRHRGVLCGGVDSDVHLFVADVVKPFDIVDRGIRDRVLISLMLPGWFWQAYFEYHAHVRLRIELAAIPHGSPLWPCMCLGAVILIDNLGFDLSFVLTI